MVDARERPPESVGMERSSLAKILADIPGVENKKDDYQVSAEVRLDVHLGGDDGQAMTLNDVAQLTLEDHFVRMVSRDDESRHYFEYDSVVGVSARSVSRGSRRPGF